MKKLALLLAVLLFVADCSFAAQNYSYENANPQSYSQAAAQEQYSLVNNTLKGSVLFVPAGQTFKALFTAPISSETASVGQNVVLALASDFYYGEKQIAPAGSSVNGTVISVSSAKHGSLNGKLAVRFTQIVTPVGTSIPISAVIKTDDYSGMLIGGTKLDVAKEYSKDVAIGASSGALAGLIISPLAGGSIGKGTALSTAVGAGGGLVKSIWDKGSDVNIPANANIELILTQPITVNPVNIEDKSYGQ